MRKKYPLGRSDSVGNKEALETGDCVWIELHHSSPKEPSHHHHSQPRRSPLSAAEITTLSRGDHHSQPPRSLEYIGSLLPFHLTDVRFYHSVTHWRLVRPNSRPHLLLFSDLCWWLSQYFCPRCQTQSQEVWCNPTSNVTNNRKYILDQLYLYMYAYLYVYAYLYMYPYLYMYLYRYFIM